MADHTIGRLEDFPQGSSTIVKIRNTEIGVFNVDGTLYALPNLCPHQYGPLCRGKISGTMASGPESDWTYEWVRDGEIVTCPWHGIEFDIASGSALASPRMRVRQYPVVVVDEEVIVSL